MSAEEVAAVPELPPRQISRHEAKARANFEKVPGLEKVENRMVKLKRAGATFNMAQADVYFHKASKTYIIFGEPVFEDPTQRFAQQAAAGQEEAKAAADAAAAGETKDAETTEEVEAEPVDATGVDDTDISLVMSQADCTREAAIKAIKENNNDVVAAIMALSE
ncbi:NAC A/B domain [Carpediemonas membranifera]|uniref:NAC A/B domain n=1 Tax=Carpediemonas membranifera TaxID=201153 RepID=A0A8J6B287_9EUKA|nr:NAC A/B domain [Carpediemonas membranifera]|eukprot:KAG9391427.1 NAC A/B domain [Carpediemonas membranifera]